MNNMNNYDRIVKFINDKFPDEQYEVVRYGDSTVNRICKIGKLQYLIELYIGDKLNDEPKLIHSWTIYLNPQKSPLKFFIGEPKFDSHLGFPYWIYEDYLREIVVPDLIKREEENNYVI